jgi:hypothetical protein
MWNELVEAVKTRPNSPTETHLGYLDSSKPLEPAGKSECRSMLHH